MRPARGHSSASLPLPPREPLVGEYRSKDKNEAVAAADCDMLAQLQKAGGGAEPSVGKVEAAGKKFLQDAPLPPAKRAELKKMLDEYLTMQAVLG